MDELLQDVYTEYSKEIYRYFYGLTLDAGLSEDLTADVFLEAVKSLHTFRNDSSIKTWLFSIARHCWFHYLQKKKIQPSIVSACIFTAGGLIDEYSLEKHISDRAMIARIEELLHELSPKAEKVMKMRMEGFSYHEISAEMKISENSARVMEFRAKTKIRQILKEEGFLDE